MKNPLIALGLGLLVSAGSARAVVTLEAHYGLGEPGTTNNGGTQAAPYTGLVDDVATGGNNTIENSASLSATIGTTGVAAPGSTAYLTKTQAGGWYDTAGANNFNLANTAADWAVQLWIRPGTNGGTLAFQTDSQGPTTGETVWLTNTSGGTFGFGNGASGVSNQIATSSAYTVGTWYRVGIVNYGGTMYYYVDGTQVGTAARAGTLSAIELGWAAGINPTSGAFDELNVWSFNSGSDSLSAVTATMNAVPEPSTYGLSGAGALALAAFARRRRHTV